MRVLLPKRLSSSLRPAATLHPMSLSIKDEVIPCSSATMMLPEGEKLTIRDWVRLYTADGDAGIFRVTAMTPAYPGATKATLAHGFCALNDAHITGKGTLEGTLAEIVERLLPHQKATAGEQLIYALGTFADTPRISLPYENDSLLDLVKRACEKLPDHKLTLDQSSLPWRIGCEALPAAPTAEGRFARNLQTISMDVDDDDLCTRLIVQRVDASGNRYYTTHNADTIDTYGVVERIYEPPFGATDAEIAAYVDEYLRQHKEPTTAITVDMLSLSHLTGEPADRLTTGKLLRCCMPDYGTTITNRIMAVEYTDLVADPLAARVYLRNKTKDASDLFRQVQQQTSNNSIRYGRSSYKLEQTGWDLVRTYEELTELDEYTRHLFNEVGIRLNAVDSTILEYATSIETLFDDTGTLQETSRAAWEKIDGMEGSITLHGETITRIDERQTSLIGEVQVLSGSVALKASKTDVDLLTEEVTELSTTFTVSYDNIRASIQESDKTVTQLDMTIRGLEHWVTDAEGNVADLTNTVRGLESTVSSVDGRMSVMSNTIDGFTSTILSQSSGFSNFETRLNEVAAHVRGIEGNIGSFSVQAETVAASVAAANGRLGRLEVTADGVAATVSDQDNRLAAIRVDIDRISNTVQDSDGKLAEFLTQADRISGTLTDATGKITSLMELTDERFDTVIGDINTVNGKVGSITGSTLWQTRDSITGVVGKMTVGKDGKLYINEGSGLMITQGGASYGVYTNNNLTAGVIVNKINGGTVQIKAERVDLGAYATVKQLEAEMAKFDQLTSGIAEAAVLKATMINCTSSMVFRNVPVGLRSGNFVTDVTFPKYVEKTIYYKDYNGNNQSMLVLTPTKNVLGSVSKSQSYAYIGA